MVAQPSAVRDDPRMAAKKRMRGESKGSKKAVPTTAPPKKSVEVKIDAKLKKQWEAAASVLRDARRRGMSAFDELWETVAEVAEHEPPLYLAAGCATFKDFLERYVQEDERTARRNMRVARFASPDEEERYGVSKIDAALGYLEAKTGDELVGRLPVAFDKLKIPTNDDGGRKQVAFADATVQQLAAATRVLRNGKTAGRANEPPLVKAVRRLLDLDGLRGVSVKLAGGKLALGGIDPSVVAALGRALARAKSLD